MSFLEAVRALQSKEFNLQKRISIAWDSLPSLEQPLKENDAPSGGLVGHAHFVQYIFQWTLATLVRAVEGSTKGERQAPGALGGISQDVRNTGKVDRERSAAQKRVVQLEEGKAGSNTGNGHTALAAVCSIRDTDAAEAPGDEPESVLPILDIRVWKLLRASLLSDRLGEDAPVSAALLQVIQSVLASATLANDANRGALAVAELDPVITTVLKVLLTRFTRSFRPSLDQWAAVVEAALRHPALLSGATANQGPPLMGQTILLLVQGLDAACRAHANPRKVFTLQVSRLLMPMLTAQFSLRGAGCSSAQQPRASSRKRGVESWPEGMLQALVSMLEGGLFHEAHIGGYSDVCLPLEGAVTAGDAEGTEDDQGEQPKKRRKKTGNGKAAEGATKAKLASYHRLLFQELEAGVNRNDQAVIESLEWFMRTYMTARKRHVEDGPKSARTPEDLAPAHDDVSPDDAPQAKPASVDAAMKRQLSESEVSFRLFAELMRPLLRQLEAGGMGEEALVGLVRGSRLLLAAAKEGQAYVPTEDTPSRAHYHFLERVKAAVISVIQPTQTREPSAAGVGSPVALSQAAADSALPSSVTGQVLSFLSVLLETEYRVLENDLVPLWGLLLRGAEVGVGEPSRGVRRPGDSFPPVPPELKAWVAAKATRVGCRLLEVYSELRQVEHLLTALADSLSSSCSGGASWLVCSPPFLQTLARVVQKLPMGQAAPLLRMLARDQTLLHERTTAGPVTSPFAALTELHVSILNNIHVSEGNAVAIGTAARQILHAAVAPHLAPKLRAWCQSGPDNGSVASVHVENVVQKGTNQRGNCSGDIGTADGGTEDAALLRIFLAAHSLHEHATSLMPPTVAAKAADGLFSLEPSHGLHPDSLGETESAGELRLYERSILAALGCGSGRLSAVLRQFEGGLKASPELGYALNCTVLQELERLGRAVRRLERGVTDVGSDACLPSLQSEMAFLVRSLLPDSREVGRSQGLATEERALGRERIKASKKSRQNPSKLAAARLLDGKGAEASASDGWDNVVSSLTDRNYHTAKWRLVCLSVDLWAPLAAGAECTAFLSRILNTVENEGVENGVSAAHVPESEATAACALTDRHPGLGGADGAPLARGNESGLWQHVGQEVQEELELNKPAPLLTAQASTLDLLRDASFYEQAAFRKQLPSLVLDELRKRVADATADVRSSKETPTSGLPVLTSSADAGVSQGGVGGLQGLVACEALLRFLSRLGRGFLLPEDVGRVVSTLLDMERSLLAAARSTTSDLSSRRTLLSFVGLCHHTLHYTLASNATASLSTPEPTLPTGTLSKSLAAFHGETLAFTSAETHATANSTGARLPQPMTSTAEVLAILSTVHECARAGVNTPGVSVAPFVFSTKAIIQILVANRLEAARFCPLQVGDLQAEESAAEEGRTSSASSRSTSPWGPDDDFLRAALEAILGHWGRARAFLSGHQSARSDFSHDSRPEVGPASLLPRTVLLAVKNRGSGPGAAPRKGGQGGDGVGRGAQEEGTRKAADGQRGSNGKGDSSGLLSDGWAETASAAANAAAVLTAVQEAMEKRDQACRAGRDTGVTWQAPSATWQAVLDRLESSIVEGLSLLIGAPQQAVGSSEEEGRAPEKKGRRVLLGDLEGLDTVLQENGGESDVLGGRGDGVRKLAAASTASHFPALTRELCLGTAEVACHKRALVGELFAAVGSAIRIRCLLASPHVRMLPNFLPGATSTGPLDKSPDRASSKEAETAGAKRAAEENGSSGGKKKKRKAGKGEVGVAEKGIASEREGIEARKAVEFDGGEKGAAVPTDGSLGENLGAAAQGAFAPTVPKQSAGMGGSSRALASLGRHLAAASDVIGQLIHATPSITTRPQSTELQDAFEDKAHIESLHMLAQILMFLEAAGQCFPLLQPAPPIAAFDWLVDTHLALLGASLSPSPKISDPPKAGGLEGVLSAVRSGAEACFGTLIKGASRQQLLRVLGAVEDAMVEGEGARRSEAAVGAVAVLLEAVSGSKSLRLLASHAPRLLSVLFSVLASAAGQSQPWATTSAGLLTSTLQVLTTVVSREALFPLSAGHVGLALGVPAALFQTSQIRTRIHGPQLFGEAQGPNSSVDPVAADYVSVGECATLCAASRLLQAVLRHRPKEVRRCAALLVGSVQAMLQAVATWSQESGREHATRTACAALRRVYEEVSNHKASLSHYCVHMLADYLAALCGLTASKAAISRDAATTLRSGIFALFDSCSPYDLQQLHASLGADGMRRNALTALRQDYEKRHKYTGKV